MMSLSDQDLELLEAYVDGELSGADEEELRRRLDGEPALAATLETLRAEAHVRSVVWKGYEPDEASVRRLIARVDASVDRSTIWSHRLSKIRTLSAAAACIVLGVLIGRATNLTGRSSHGPAGVRATDVDYRVDPRLVPPLPQEQPQQAAPQQADGGAPVKFRIVDGNGNPITLQPFNSQKDADDFLEDLARWQRQQEQLRNSGTTLPSTGQF